MQDFIQKNVLLIPPPPSSAYATARFLPRNSFCLAGILFIITHSPHVVMLRRAEKGRSATLGRGQCGESRGGAYGAAGTQRARRIQKVIMKISEVYVQQFRRHIPQLWVSRAHTLTHTLTHTLCLH